MSQISGFRRTLSHANSLPGGDHTPVPKFGVNTEKESKLAEVRSKLDLGIRSKLDKGMIEITIWIASN